MGIDRESPGYRLCKEEVKYVLADERGRRFLWRLLVELLRIEATDFPQNAGVYALCGKQQAGRILLSACREFDFENVQKAEREYHDLQKRLGEARGKTEEDLKI